MNANDDYEDKCRLCGAESSFMIPDEEASKILAARDDDGMPGVKYVVISAPCTKCHQIVRKMTFDCGERNCTVEDLEVQ